MRLSSVGGGGETATLELRARARPWHLHAAASGFQLEEDTMARRGTVKNRKQYNALKRKGMSKQRAAKISNAGKSASRKGGRSSHKGRKRR
jgi:hypothetical protein